MNAAPAPKTAGHRGLLVLLSLALPFVVLRIALAFSPDSDFNVFSYNIHHLFTGLLLVTIGGIPLALFPGAGRLLDLAAVAFGAGLSLALDEWVYLIVTDGSNASYLLPVSFWGGLVMVGLACLYALALLGLARRRPAS
jgi:hypothetical protein